MEERARILSPGKTVQQSKARMRLCYLYGSLRCCVNMTGTGSDVGSAGGSARGSLRPGRNEDTEHVALLTANLALRFIFMVCTAICIPLECTGPCGPFVELDMLDWCHSLQSYGNKLEVYAAASVSQPERWLHIRVPQLTMPDAVNSECFRMSCGGGTACCAVF